MVILLQQGLLTYNQSLEVNDVEESVASATVLSVSVKWMKSRNKCDTTEKCFHAHQQ